MSLDFRLDEIDLETVQSGDIEEIKKMLEESNIIGKKNEEIFNDEFTTTEKKTDNKTISNTFL